MDRRLSQIIELDTISECPAKAINWGMSQLNHCTLFTAIGMTFMGEYLIMIQTPDGHSYL